MEKATSDKNVIEISGLTKFYGESRGIVSVDLDVRKGEIFGLIGPNGAGKSTLIRTLLGLVHKTSGSATVFGLDFEAERSKILSEIGYLPSEVNYYDNMKAIDLLKYSASFYKKDCSQKIDKLAEILELDLSRKIEDMSLGNRKKVGIVQALLHSPKLLILDEPTSSLDPLIQHKFFDIIKHESKKGTTVLFSSHVLSEVQQLCDRVCILKDGKIVDVQDVAKLKMGAYKKVKITLCEVCQENLVLLGSLQGVKNIETKDNEVTFIFNGDCNELLKALSQCSVVNLNINDPSIEEIFMHYYTDSNKE